MNIRNFLMLLWAIDRGGLPRIFVLTGIVMFLAIVMLIFLSLIGGPGELVRHLQRP
jgi:hypothetical protein